ncbi:hypothetical protein M758_3G012300 [Ceratodon purpureus]|nr:hypothetical protein M758_3G012300 [Ceratodon purpureus]
MTLQMRFGCLDRRTLCIADEVGSMKVSTWSTKATDVHDFTPDSSTRHWTCLPEVPPDVYMMEQKLLLHCLTSILMHVYRS